MSETSPETIRSAQLAFQDFSRGLAKGDWQPFLDRLSDDFQFWFPAGPFQGWNQGRDKARDFFTSVSSIFPEGLTLEVEQITSNDTNVVFEVRSQGVMLGNPYQNQAAIAFEIRDGKVCRYREYLGVIFQLESAKP